MAWRDIWRGRTSSGREVAVQEDDDGDIRVGVALQIEPDDGQSLEDALMTQGGYSAEEAATHRGPRRGLQILVVQARSHAVERESGTLVNASELVLRASRLNWPGHRAPGHFVPIDLKPRLSA